MTRVKQPDFFTRFANKTSLILGRPLVFAAAVALLVLWALSGPFLGFSEVWQLIINTITTLITFLMVFIIQNTQNRDNMAMNIKLDAILDELGVTDEELMKAEDESDKDLEHKKKRVQKHNGRKKSKAAKQ